MRFSGARKKSRSDDGFLEGKILHQFPRKTGLGNRNGRRKRISFDPRGNRVCFVSTPPKSEYKKYWFTESQRIVRKGLQFEVEPDIMIELNIDSRVQLTALSQSSAASGPLRRSFLEIQELAQSFLGEPNQGSWFCVGSAHMTHIDKVCVVLPAGTYRLRCVGKNSIQVFAQVWHIKRELQ